MPSRVQATPPACSRQGEVRALFTAFGVAAAGGLPLRSTPCTHLHTWRDCCRRPRMPHHSGSGRSGFHPWTPRQAHCRGAAVCLHAGVEGGPACGQGGWVGRGCVKSKLKKMKVTVPRTRDCWRSASFAASKASSLLPQPRVEQHIARTSGGAGPCTARLRRPRAGSKQACHRTPRAGRSRLLLRQEGEVDMQCAVHVPWSRVEGPREGAPVHANAMGACPLCHLASVG